MNSFWLVLLIAKLYSRINIFKEKEEENINYQEFEKIDKGKTPLELDFFVGGKNTNSENKAKLLNLNEQNIKFLKYFQSDVCSVLLAYNNIKINVETRDIYFDNVNNQKNIHIFFFL